MILDQLQELCENATPGPWHFDIGNMDVESRHSDGWRTELCVLTHTSERLRGKNYDSQRFGDYVSDGEFIAAARDAMPKLIAVARAAKEISKQFPPNSLAWGHESAERLARALQDLERSDSTVSPVDEEKK